MRTRLVLMLMLALAACGRVPPLPEDHPANPAAPTGSVIPPSGLDAYLAPDTLTKRADAAARAPQASRGHTGH